MVTTTAASPTRPAPTATSRDPLFCDVAGGDYRVAEDGPVRPRPERRLRLIGALEATLRHEVTPVEDPQIPAAFAVEPNFPNPFNPVTTIRFAIPTAARTTVTVFDLRGRVVKTLVDAELPAATTRSSGAARRPPDGRRPPESTSTG